MVITDVTLQRVTICYEWPGPFVHQRIYKKVLKRCFENDRLVRVP